jgi:sec-independent protein translocase protein TatA
MQLLAGLGPLGLPELLIIAFVVVLIFGVGRLPEVGGALGKGIREFRKATKEDDAAAGTTTLTSNAGAAPPTGSADAGASELAGGSDVRYCSECGAGNLATAKFCAQCGHQMAAPVR